MLHLYSVKIIWLNLETYQFALYLNHCLDLGKHLATKKVKCQSHLSPCKPKLKKIMSSFKSTSEIY